MFLFESHSIVRVWKAERHGDGEQEKLVYASTNIKIFLLFLLSPRLTRIYVVGDVLDGKTKQNSLIETPTSVFILKSEDLIFENQT